MSLCSIILYTISIIILLSMIVSLVFSYRCEGFRETKSFSRKDYYLGGLSKIVNIKYSDIPWGKDKVYLIDENILHSDSGFKSNYVNEMSVYYKELRRKYPSGDYRILLIPGDVIHSFDKFPIISKTRPIDKPGMNVILPLNNKRHWKPVSDAYMLDTLDWDKKNDTIVWRGVATGRDKRFSLVEKWYDYPNKDEIDVAFTGFNNAYMGSKDSKYIGDRIDMRELLENKYLISVEGNDVATNLKWILSSKTVCIMPKPTIESWLMESQLKPWVHYVPVKSDFSDLKAIYSFCKKNPVIMKQIIYNANEYMEQFKNQEEEHKLIMDILKTYCDRTNLMF